MKHRPWYSVNRGGYGQCCDYMNSVVRLVHHFLLRKANLTIGGCVASKFHIDDANIDRTEISTTQLLNTHQNEGGPVGEITKGIAVLVY